MNTWTFRQTVALVALTLAVVVASAKADEVRKPECAASAAEKHLLKRVIERLKSFPEGKELFDKAEKIHGGALKIEVYRGKERFRGFWLPDVKTIQVRVKPDLDDTAGFLFYELLRAVTWPERIRFHERAKAGEIGREDFARDIECWSYALVKRHNAIASRGIEAKAWGATFAVYREDLKECWPTLQHYLVCADKPLPGGDRDTSHTGFHRKVWDNHFREHWEKHQQEMAKQQRQRDNLKKQQAAPVRSVRFLVEACRQRPVMLQRPLFNEHFIHLDTLVKKAYREALNGEVSHKTREALGAVIKQMDADLDTLASALPPDETKHLNAAIRFIHQLKAAKAWLRQPGATDVLLGKAGMP